MSWIRHSKACADEKRYCRTVPLVVAGFNGRRILSCVCTVDDMRGLTAWQRLYKKYNPKTMARAIRLVAAVTHPPMLKELKHVEAALDKCEEHGKVLKKDFGEVFSETVRVGIVTVMMPELLQELVYSSLGIAFEYDISISKIRALASNKVAMADGPRLHGCGQGARRLCQGSNGVL